MSTRAGSYIRSILCGRDHFAPYPEVTQCDAELLSQWIAALTIEPILAKAWLCPKGWALRDRVVVNDMAFCIISGKYAGCLESPKHEQPLLPGDILLIPRETPHWIRRVDDDCQMVSLHLNAKIYNNIDALPFLRLGGIYRKPDDDLYRQTAMRLAREDEYHPAGWHQTLRNGMETIILTALRYSVNNLSQPPLPHILQQIGRLHPVLQIINERLADPSLRISELASAANVSEATLRKWFSKTFRKSPVEFLHRERISRACTLLRTTCYPISFIAEKTGFTDVPFFYRIFKQVVGTTPARYRQKREE